MNFQTTHDHHRGISRRVLLQAGYSGLLGVDLPTSLARQSRAVESHGAVKPRRAA